MPGLKYVVPADHINALAQLHTGGIAGFCNAQHVRQLLTCKLQATTGSQCNQTGIAHTPQPFIARGFDARTHHLCKQRATPYLAGTRQQAIGGIVITCCRQHLGLGNQNILHRSQSTLRTQQPRPQHQSLAEFLEGASGAVQFPCTQFGLARQGKVKRLTHLIHCSQIFLHMRILRPQTAQYRCLTLGIAQGCQIFVFRQCRPCLGQ